MKQFVLLRASCFTGVLPHVITVGKHLQNAFIRFYLSTSSCDFIFLSLSVHIRWKNTML